MSKKIIVSVLLIAFMAFFGLSSGAYAAGETFNGYLGYGARGLEVTYLQQFLIDHGLLHIPSATGNYLSLTTTAVKNYQASQGIINTGYFGPLTSGAANAELRLANKPVLTHVTDVAVKGPSNFAAVLFANKKTISWQTSDYPANLGVNINLLRKVSDSPVSYEYVRTLASNTPNDGVESWSPAFGEDLSNLYVEVVCPVSVTTGCQSGSPVAIQ